MAGKRQPFKKRGISGQLFFVSVLRVETSICPNAGQKTESALLPVASRTVRENRYRYAVRRYRNGYRKNGCIDDNRTSVTSEKQSTVRQHEGFDVCIACRPGNRIDIGETDGIFR